MERLIAITKDELFRLMTQFLTMASVFIIGFVK